MEDGTEGTEEADVPDKDNPPTESNSPEDDDRKLVAEEIRIYSSDTILPVVSFVLVIVFWCWLIYAISVSLAEYFNVNGTVLDLCQVGECPTDKETGEKKCPPDPGTRYAYDPVVQFCQPRYFCQGTNSQAVQDDGSTDPRGYCSYSPLDPTVREECRCLQNPYCARYILSFFRTTSGNAYSDAQSTFTQVLDPDYTNGTRQGYQSLGLKMLNNLTDFCTVPIGWIYRTNPGCSYDQSKTPYENASACTQQNPCNVGVLAFISDDASSFTTSDVNYYPVGCVPGEPCRDPGQVSIYDTSYGKTLCRVPIKSLSDLG